MLVYRIENDRRQGPYIDRHYEPMSDAHNGSPSTHPGICADTNWEFDPDHHICGFDDIDKLFNWFDGFLEKLAQLGFHIGVYDIGPTGILNTNSGTQIAFYRDLATHVENVELI